MGKIKGTTLAYMAGIIDGEGSIMLEKRSQKANRRKYQIRLHIAVGNTNEWLINWLKFNFGGTISYCPREDSKRKDYWIWKLVSRQASDFLQMILPYLNLKRPQAELAIRFQQHKKLGPLPDEQAAIDEAERLLMKQLNHKGKKL